MTEHEHHEYMHHHHEMMQHEGHEMVANAEMPAHEMHHMHHGTDFLRRLWGSLILALPLLALTPMMGTAWQVIPDFSGNQVLILLLGTALYVYGGWPFLTGARDELRAKQPAMMTLIALGITVAFVYSSWQMLIGGAMAFWWELATLILIMLLGHWLEMRAVMRANSALESLASLLPKEATKADGNVIKLSDVQIGDVLRVSAHERIPADSQLVSAHAKIDEALLTGEAALVHKHAGDALIGGSVNGDHVIEIQVTKTGAAGYLAQVQRLVARAQEQKSRVETLANRVASWLFYAAISVAVVSFVVWLMTDTFDMAVMTAVMVLIIACPHALGLAVPLVSARMSALAAQRGLLIQNKTPLEQTAALRYVLLDKTGTLTQGDFSLTKLVNWSDLSDDEILAAVQALEGGSTHPIALAIQKMAIAHNHTFSHAHDVQTIAGVGVRGQIGAEVWQVTRQAGEHVVAETGTVSYVWRGDEAIAALVLGDQVKSDAQDFIHQIKARGLTPVLVTGDNPQTAQAVATQLGIDEVHAGVTPEQKAALVTDYQKHGGVLFVGDGVNDGPALAQADLGVAIGAGTAVAIDSADVVLSQSRPLDVVGLLDLAAQSRRKMAQNLWWGAGYNVLAIPLAAGVLAPVGVTLSPMIAAVLMSVSTVVVAVNALRLR